MRPLSYAGRTEHEGTSEAAQARYDAKRENAETSSTAERSRPYVGEAVTAWRELAAGTEDRVVSHRTYATCFAKCHASCGFWRSDYPSAKQYDNNAIPDPD